MRFRVEKIKKQMISSYSVFGASALACVAGVALRERFLPQIFVVITRDNDNTVKIGLKSQERNRFLATDAYITELRLEPFDQWEKQMRVKSLIEGKFEVPMRMNAFTHGAMAQWKPCDKKDEFQFPGLRLIVTTRCFDFPLLSILTQRTQIFTVNPSTVNRMLYK